VGERKPKSPEQQNVRWEFQPPPAGRHSRWGFRGMTVRNWLDLLVVPLALAGIGYWFTSQQDYRQQATEELRAQHAALQAYLDQMSVLLLEKDLRTAEAGSEVRRLARARTLTVLSQLPATPGEHETNKEQVLEFLIEAELVQRMNGEDPIISLEESDLRRVDLDWEDLHGANLRNALLGEADLEGANLEDANLEQAKLRGANLRGVKGATNEQLEQQAASLEGATMPNGQKYEDWLKSRGSRENGGPS
jgi:hypothetical protein